MNHLRRRQVLRTSLFAIGLLLLVVTTFSACNKRAEDVTRGEAVEIRIHNVSSFDFGQVIVNTSANEQNYGSVPANEKSDYRSFFFAYRYAAVSAFVNGTHYQLQPIDYSGETTLLEGNYTYELDFDTINQELVLDFRAD